MDYKLINKWLPNNHIHKLQNKPLFFLNSHKLRTNFGTILEREVSLTEIYKITIHPFKEIILHGRVIYISENFGIQGQTTSIWRTEPQDFFGKIYFNDNVKLYPTLIKSVKSILCSKREILPLVCTDKFFTNSDIFTSPYAFRHKIFQFLKNHPNNFITEWN